MRMRHPVTRQIQAILTKSLALLSVVTVLSGCGAGGPASIGSTSSSGETLARLASASSSSDVLNAALPSLPPTTDVPRSSSGLQKIVVTLRDALGKDVDPGKASEALKATAASIVQKGGSVTHELSFIGAIAAEVPDAGVEALRRDPRVAYVEPDLPMQCLATELDRCWGVNRVGAPTVFAQGNRGAGIRVAIIDTGVDYTHPDLRDAYAGGYDFHSRDNDPMDEHWHGTHVAGIVAARANDTGAVGVAPECRLYALKVCGASGAGSFSAISAALQWCVQNRIQVANVSLGSGSHPGKSVENAFAAARSAGVVVVAAAGNSGSSDGTGNTVTWPGAFETCICVAAVDGKNNRVGFSGSGPRVDVCAPGAGIYSCLPRGGYGSMSGTSMASPHVAGVVALALARGFSPSAARSRLLGNAIDLGAAGRDSLYGTGLASVDRLMSGGDSPPFVTITAPLAGASLPRGKTVTFSAKAEDVEDGDVTSRIVWTVAGQTYARPTVTLNLPDGPYTASATVLDSRGQRGSSTVQITVRDQVPVVLITGPASGMTYSLGKAIVFSARATDAEEGDLSSAIVWTFNNQAMGTGPRLTYSSLPVGSFTFHAQVRDSTGQTGKGSVKVNIVP